LFCAFQTLFPCRPLNGKGKDILLCVLGGLSGEIPFSESVPDDCTLVRRFGQPGVEAEIALLKLRFRPFPAGQAILDLCLRDMKVKFSAGNVDGDQVPVLNDRERAAFGRFR